MFCPIVGVADVLIELDTIALYLQGICENMIIFPDLSVCHS